LQRQGREEINTSRLGRTVFRGEKQLGPSEMVFVQDFVCEALYNGVFLSSMATKKQDEASTRNQLVTALHGDTYDDLSGAFRLRTTDSPPTRVFEHPILCEFQDGIIFLPKNSDLYLPNGLRVTALMVVILTASTQNEAMDLVNQFTNPVCF
jgi:hypothetical protein